MKHLEEGVGLAYKANSLAAFTSEININILLIDCLQNSD